MGKKLLTTDELSYIEANYKTISWYRMARILNRPTSTIQYAAHVRGWIKNKRQFKPLIPWTDMETGYLAGLIDGEGSISVQFHNKNATPTITIANTDLKLLEYAQSLTAGALEIAKALHGHQKKPCHRLYIVSRHHVSAVLERITPHLHSKQAQGELVLRYCKLRLSKNPIFGQGTQPIGDEEMAIIEEVRKLNHR